MSRIFSDLDKNTCKVAKRIGLSQNLDWGDEDIKTKLQPLLLEPIVVHSDDDEDF